MVSEPSADNNTVPLCSDGSENLYVVEDCGGLEVACTPQCRYTEYFRVSRHLARSDIGRYKNIV